MFVYWVRNNYGIRIVNIQHKIAENNIGIGNAGYLPSIDLLAGHSGTLYNTGTTAFSGETDKFNANNTTSNIGINLDWLVFDGFRIQTNYEKLQELGNVSELNVRIQIEDFVSRLTSEYYHYVQQQIRLKNLSSALVLSRERLRIVGERYSLGNLSRLDLQQAKSDFNADSSRLIKQLETLYSSLIQLNKLMTLSNIQQQIVCSDTAIIANDALNEENLWNSTLSVNAALLLAEKEQSISNLDYNLIKSRNYPYLRLNAGYGYTLYSYNTGTYKKQSNLGMNYGITLGFNLFNGLNDRREAENVRLQIESKKLEYQQLELNLKADFSNIWMAYRNNLELTELEKQNLSVSYEYYDIALERYKLGDLSGIELREAQNSLLEAEERLLTAEFNTKICEISLMQISGKVLEYMK